jgi:hypothetical protein
MNCVHLTTFSEKRLAYLVLIFSEKTRKLQTSNIYLRRVIDADTHLLVFNYNEMNKQD